VVSGFSWLWENAHLLIESFTKVYRQEMTAETKCMDDLLAQEAEHNRLRRVAFLAVAISTAAVFASIVTMPLIYSYVQAIQSQINAEVGFCRVSSHL
jgi:hypothetical protein